jgi:hypothetical protein
METLTPVFDAHTISEWMEQKLLPLFKLLGHIQTAAQQLRARKYWPTRPLKQFDSWDYYGIKIEEEAPSVQMIRSTGLTITKLNITEPVTLFSLHS